MGTSQRASTLVVACAARSVPDQVSQVSAPCTARCAPCACSSGAATGRGPKQPARGSAATTKSRATTWRIAGQGGGPALKFAAIGLNGPAGWQRRARSRPGGGVGALPRRPGPRGRLPAQCARRAALPWLGHDRRRRVGARRVDAVVLRAEPAPRRLVRLEAERLRRLVGRLLDLPQGLANLGVEVGMLGQGARQLAVEVVLRLLADLVGHLLELLAQVAEGLAHLRQEGLDVGGRLAGLGRAPANPAGVKTYAVASTSRISAPYLASLAGPKPGMPP